MQVGTGSEQRLSRYFCALIYHRIQACLHSANAYIWTIFDVGSIRLQPISTCQRLTTVKSVTTTVFVRSTKCAAMSIPKSFTTKKVLRRTLKNASSAIIRTSRRANDNRPIPEVRVDGKLGEGGYNDVYLVSWVCPS